MTSRQELLDAYVALWEENGEPPGSVQVNLKTEFYVSDYTETLGVEWEEMPDLCRAEELIESENENAETQQETQEASEEEREAADNSDPIVRAVDDSVREDDFQLEGPSITDSELANGSFGPRSEMSVRVTLYELHRSLDRPLKPTDLALREDLSAHDIAGRFDGWQQAGSETDVPVAEPTWHEAIVEELRLARTRMDDQRQSFGRLYDFMSGRIELLFPDCDDLQTKVREQLGKLEEQHLVHFERESDMYSIVCDPVELSSKRDRTTASTTEETPSERQLRTDEFADSLASLERLCSILERQLRYGADETAGQTLRRLNEELGNLSNDVEDADRHLRIRLESLRSRANTAGSAVRLRQQLQDEGDSTIRRRLTEQLRELAEIFGETPREDVAGLCGNFPLQLYIDEFGSWDGAIQAAGLDPIDETIRARRTYDRLTVLEQMVQIVDTLGRTPTHDEVGSMADFTSTTVKNRLGSWKQALQFTKALSREAFEGGYSGPLGGSETSGTQGQNDEDSNLGDRDILARLKQDIHDSR